MGRERQRKKARSSLPRIKQHAKPKSSQRSVPRDDLVSQHWDRHATLSQNYRRLGLAAKLGSRPAGGVERDVAAASSTSSPFTPVARSRGGSGPANAKSLIGHEVKVKRDSKGNLVEVLHSDGKRANPLGDLLVEVEEDEDEEDGDGWEGLDGETETTERPRRGIVRELEEKAARAAPKRPRQQSQREQEWIERLVAKYADDYGKMARDRKLNPMQQTAADIRRRVGKWRTSSKSAAVVAGST